MRPDHYKRRSKNYKRDGYSRDYERKRKNSGKQFKDGFKAILRMVRKFLKRNPEYESMLCALMAWLMMKRYSCSIRGMVEECDARPAFARSWAWTTSRPSHGCTRYGHDTDRSA